MGSSEGHAQCRRRPWAWHPMCYARFIEHAHSRRLEVGVAPGRRSLVPPTTESSKVVGDQAKDFMGNKLYETPTSTCSLHGRFTFICACGRHPRFNTGQASVDWTLGKRRYALIPVAFFTSKGPSLFPFKTPLSAKTRIAVAHGWGHQKDTPNAEDGRGRGTPCVMQDS